MTKSIETFEGEGPQVDDVDVAKKRHAAATCAVRSAIANSYGDANNNVFDETNGYNVLIKAFADQGFVKSSAARFVPKNDLYMSLKGILGEDPSKPVNTAMIHEMLGNMHFNRDGVSRVWLQEYASDDAVIATKPCRAVPDVAPEQKTAMLTRRAKLIACALKKAKTLDEFSSEMSRMGVSEASYVRSRFIYQKAKLWGITDQSKISPWIEIILEDELIKTNGKGYADVESAAENCESKGRLGVAPPSPPPTPPTPPTPPAPKVSSPPASIPQPPPEPTPTTNKFHEFMKKYWMIFVIGLVILFVIIGVIALTVSNSTPVPPPAPLPIQPVSPPMLQQSPEYGAEQSKL